MSIHVYMFISVYIHASPCISTYTYVSMHVYSRIPYIHIYCHYRLLYGPPTRCGDSFLLVTFPPALGVTRIGLAVGGRGVRSPRRLSGPLQTTQNNSIYKPPALFLTNRLSGLRDFFFFPELSSTRNKGLQKTPTSKTVTDNRSHVISSTMAWN